MGIIHRLLSKYSEPYRIRNGFGLSPIRTKKELKALITFCENEMMDSEHMKLNPNRKDIYNNTIKLYWQNGEVSENNHVYTDVNRYIRDHCSWYWN